MIKLLFSTLVISGLGFAQTPKPNYHWDHSVLLNEWVLVVDHRVEAYIYADTDGYLALKEADNKLVSLWDDLGLAKDEAVRLYTNPRPTAYGNGCITFSPVLGVGGTLAPLKDEQGLPKH